MTGCAGRVGSAGRWGLPLLLAASIAVAVAAGCGGDSSAEGPVLGADTTMKTVDSLTRAGFVAHVNGLCRKAWLILRQNFVEYSGTLPRRMPLAHRYANAVRLSYLAGVDFHIFDMIYRLGAPPGEEGEAEELIGILQIGVERGLHGPRLHSKAEVARLFARFNPIARRYGLDECVAAGGRLPSVAMAGP